MNLSIISFTQNGLELSKRVADSLTAEAVIYTKSSFAKKSNGEPWVSFVEESIGGWTKKQMQEKNALLFIGACGIAVRAIAPYITDKLYDSPVLVMDEQGRYVIPILSGHMGGANELAMQIAEKMKALPIITTATDIQKQFAVDLFAKKNDLHIKNKDGIAKVSSRVLAGNIITMSIESGHLKETEKVPQEIRLVSYPPMQPVDILIASKTGVYGADALLTLQPKEYVIGMGCKRGTAAETIEALIEKTIKILGIGRDQIFALVSIDKKKDEQGFLTWSRQKRIPFYTYSVQQLQETEGTFHGSDFVKAKVGVDNVCERAALRACGMNGVLVYEKQAENGMTIAVAKREWSIAWNEK